MPTSIRDKISRLLCATLFLAWQQGSGCAEVLPTASVREQNKSQEQIESQTQSATVPLYVENNRPFIDLEFTRPDGSVRKARFWVDTGGGGFIIVEPLARELGLKFGPEVSEGGSRFATIEPPKVRLGGMPLNLKGARASVAIGQRTMMPGVPAEGLLPGHVLMRYHVIFDYPGHKFTLAKPGTVKPRGSRLPSPINQRSGFPRIEAKIGEQSYGFLLDTGASFTMVSQELLNKWGAEHSDWPRAKGAFGAANMGLGSMEANGLLMRVPQFDISTFQLRGAAVVSRPKGTFENYIIDSLRGKPGEKRLLLLERDGKQFEVIAPVIRVL